MRIWSLHPRYLDRQGLVACWRETLLAQAVLAGRTKGYTAHPQLTRWRAIPDPEGGIAAYLAALADEADGRGYRFDRTRITAPSVTKTLPVTSGQLAYEWQHLCAKLLARSPDWLKMLGEVEPLDPHPAFVAVPGQVEPWEVSSER